LPFPEEVFLEAHSCTYFTGAPPTQGLLILSVWFYLIGIRRYPYFLFHFYFATHKNIEQPINIINKGINLPVTIFLILNALFM
jgi:hypothetical protein